jgi:hypothetical protein
MPLITPPTKSARLQERDVELDPSDEIPTHDHDLITPLTPLTSTIKATIANPMGAVAFHTQLRMPLEPVAFFAGESFDFTALASLAGQHSLSLPKPERVGSMEQDANWWFAADVPIAFAFGSSPTREIPDVTSTFKLRPGSEKQAFESLKLDKEEHPIAFAFGATSTRQAPTSTFAFEPTLENTEQATSKILQSAQLFKDPNVTSTFKPTLGAKEQAAVTRLQGEIKENDKKKTPTSWPRDPPS